MPRTRRQGTGSTTRWTPPSGRMTVRRPYSCWSTSRNRSLRSPCARIRHRTRARRAPARLQACVGRCLATEVVPSLAGIAHETLAIAERHLRRGYRMIWLGRVPRTSWDSWTFGRTSVRGSGGDRWPVDVLVTMLRDSLDELLRAEPDQCAGILEVWSHSAVPLLQRLAVYGWTYRTDVSSNDRRLPGFVQRGGSSTTNYAVTCSISYRRSSPWPARQPRRPAGRGSGCGTA